MSTTPEFERAGCDPVAAPVGDPKGDGPRRLTHALLAVYLAPVVLLVLVIGGVMVVLVKAVELVARAVKAVRGNPSAAPGAAAGPREGGRPWSQPHAIPALRVSGRPGPGSPR